MPYSQKYKSRPLNQHPPKLIRYAEILAKGTFSKAEAARQAGYKQSVADGIAWRWIAETREKSEFPVLWDYYEKLRRENLRQFDITADNVAREIALIAFSDVTKFIDLPAAEYERRQRRAKRMREALANVSRYEWELKDYLERKAKRDDPSRRGPKPHVPDPPKEPSEEDKKLAQKWSLLDEDEQAELMRWENYQPGSVRIRNREDIPAALTPAISEISETREGIRVKMHDKISALDKLAKWLKMYQDAPEDENNGRPVEVNLVVNGSKSPLLKALQTSGEDLADIGIHEE